MAKDTSPKISVITPTCRAGDFIETTLASVAAQTYRNIEHILIDCVSDDDTLPVIRRYMETDPRIRLWSEPDEGIYDAMNKGLDRCTGDWIYFLGAGDTFFNDRVLHDLITAGYFGEEQIVYGNVIIRGATPWAADQTVYDGPFTLEKLFRQNICHQSMFYPRSVVGQIGYYNPNYRVTSDWDYNLRCWARYRFAFADRIIANFMAGGKSTSEAGDNSMQSDFPANVIRYFNLNPDDPSLLSGTSPFYYPASQYRITEMARELDELRDELHRREEEFRRDHETGNQEISRLHDTILSNQRQFESTAEGMQQQIESQRVQIEGLHDALLSSEQRYTEVLAGVNRENDRLSRELDAHQQENRDLKQSNTWKAGTLVLKPVRYLRRTLHWKKPGKKI